MARGKPDRSTRDRLIVAARLLFWEKGYGQTSLSDLLRKARANSGSFYYFFESKEDLLLAVLERYAEGIYPMLLEPAWRGVDDPIERIFALLTRYRELILATDCQYGCPLGRLALEISPQRRKVHKLIATNFDGWTAAVRRCLEEAGPRLPAEVDRERLSRFVLSVMEGGVMQSRSHRSVAAFDDSVAELRAYFNRLLDVPSKARGRSDREKPQSNQEKET
jgi:TetR/AcrR family transcriptional regulator, transcriptional repressor for nem operon